MVAELLAGIEVNKGIVLSLLGGVGAYLQGVRDGRIKKGVSNAFTEMTLALVMGLIVLYVGQWQAWPLPLVYVLILVLSNNASEHLSFLGSLVERLVLRKFNLKGNK